jgi:cell division protein FtsZ
MKIFEIAEANANLDKKELYTYIDNTEFSNEVKEKIKGMLGVVLSTGENDINLDFNDLKIIMSHGGMAFVGSGEYEGENSATEAIKLAIKNSTLDFDLMGKATGILIHLETHPDFPIMDIAEAMEVINENAHYEADIIWGTSTSESVGECYVKATVLFAGLIR